MTQIAKGVIKTIDKLYYDPQERALGVNAILSPILDEIRKEHPDDSPSQWDVLCWAIEYLATMSTVVDEARFTELAKGLTRWLYEVHYSNPKGIYGEPDKGRGETPGGSDG